MIQEEHIMARATETLQWVPGNGSPPFKEERQKKKGTN